MVIVAATLAVYGQTARFDFINFDDPEYVARNAHVLGGLTASGVAWAFTSGYGANWFPLTWISHMVDVQIFGAEAGWHHLTNVALHALASVLLFLFLNRATRARWPSAFVAFLFALHPLHVESVAWVAERKDVLSAVFWFLSLWGYVRYAEAPSPRRYLLMAAAFCCGLMAKPMIVTLPFVLLLLDVWPLRRTPPWRPRVREKIPLFALSAVAAVVTYSVQAASGAVRAVASLPLGLRAENALISYGWYLANTVWPSRLAVFYPFPSQVPGWQMIVSAAVLAGVTVMALWSRGKRPHLLVGWLWFLGTLVPVIGLVQVGMQARADRYLYVPMVGLGIMLAWSVPQIRAMAMAGAALCAVFAALTVVQLGYWQNSVTLFGRAVEVTADNGLAEHNLGAALMADPTRLPEAIGHLREAMRLNPNSERVRSDLGTALARAGQLAQAEQAFRAGLAIDGRSAILHNNLGNVLLNEGRVGEAMAEYQTALRIDPGYEEARRNLEVAGPNLAVSHYNAGIDLANEGRGAEAVKEFEECLQLDPNNASAQNNLGVVLSQMPGRLAEAISHFEAAVRLKPDYEDAKVNLRTAQAEKQKGGR